MLAENTFKHSPLTSKMNVDLIELYFCTHGSTVIWNQYCLHTKSTISIVAHVLLCPRISIVVVIVVVVVMVVVEVVVVVVVVVVVEVVVVVVVVVP